MGLRITRSTEPIHVERIVVALYAAPGLGKTTLSFTADRPLLLDFDGGSYRAGNRGDVVQVSKWGDVAEISADDLADYRTVVVDTAGRALDALTEVVIRQDTKNGTRSGALSIQGYGALKNAFGAWLHRVKNSGLDVILIAHMTEERKGDEIIERIDVQGGSKNEIYKSADAMGRLYMNAGKRVLNFSPSDVGYGKNPAGFEPLLVPDFGKEPQFLAGVIANIKAKLNAESEEQAQERIRTQEAREAFEKLGTPAAFGKEAERLKDAEPKIKRLLVEVATEKGYEFDAKAKAFREKVAA